MKLLTRLCIAFLISIINIICLLGKIFSKTGNGIRIMFIMLIRFPVVSIFLSGISVMCMSLCMIWNPLGRRFCVFLM